MWSTGGRPGCTPADPLAAAQSPAAVQQHAAPAAACTLCQGCDAAGSPSSAAARARARARARRVLQPHAHSIWALLWRCCTTPQGAAAAESVLRGLVAAYSELRQLPQLLAELLAASRGQLQAPAGAAEAPEGPEAPEAVMAAAGQLLARRGFLSALAAAVAHLPVGQTPTLVNVLSAELAATLQAAGQARSQKAGGSSSGGYLGAVGSLAAASLSSIRLELTSAMPVAQAAAALVSGTLAAPLAGSVAGLQAGKGPAGGQLLLLLLPAYRAALQLHASCAAMHPMVAPLPGQRASLDPYALVSEAPEPGSGAALRLLGGYFSPLQQGGGAAQAAPPGLAELVQAAEGGAAGELQQELLRCALQAALLQHQQLLHLRFTCPTTSFEEARRMKRAADKVGLGLGPAQLATGQQLRPQMGRRPRAAGMPELSQVVALANAGPEEGQEGQGQGAGG
jgi:hypothetical protein